MTTGDTAGDGSADPAVGPDHTAVRVALWRALHVEIDARPPVLDDTVGLRIAAPEEGWRDRGDMHPEGTRPFRAGIVARARFVEDLATEASRRGVGQYVILGAGLDTFAQRTPSAGPPLRVFEVDRPEPQEWKRRRLAALGLGVPGRPRFVPVDFETDGAWWRQLTVAGFDPAGPAVVASTGVSMYLTREANAATLRQLAALAPGSTLAMTFQEPPELLDEEMRAARLVAERGARAAGTPFISFFSPEEMLTLAREAGFGEVRHVSSDLLNERYFAGRADGLRTPGGEEILLATV